MNPMTTDEKIASHMASGESEKLEFKAVLPPSRSIARILCAFANSAGGALVLGVDGSRSPPEAIGLSRDFHAHEVTSRAIALLVPHLSVVHRYAEHEGTSLYVIEVEKSEEQVTVEGKIFLRSGNRVIESPQPERPVQSCAQSEALTQKLEQFALSATEAKSNFIQHYLSVLKIIGDLESSLFPNSTAEPTENQEGKILSRILFSSAADNFESYLSDLLYEIYLANPNTLKSNEQVTVKDVLECADLREFIDSWARRKLAKLERGSVKGFIKENKQIRDLAVIDSAQQHELEKVLQIRHLYTHKNGIVDDKFLKYFPGQFNLNEEHQLSVEGMIESFDYLASTVHRIDSAAVAKYRLATLA